MALRAHQPVALRVTQRLQQLLDMTAAHRERRRHARQSAAALERMHACGRDEPASMHRAAHALRESSDAPAELGPV